MICGSLTPQFPVTTLTKPRRWGRIAVLWLAVLALAGFYWVYQRKPAEPHYDVRTFRTPAGWGYEIRRDNQPVIYQPYKPAAAGNQGFESEAQARRVGGRVVDKLRRGQFPPALRPDELN